MHPGRNHRWVATAFEERATATEEQAALVKQVLSDRTAAHAALDATTEGPEADAPFKTADTQTG